jgi:hypothetical protein
VRGGRGRGAAGMGLEAIRASTAVAVTVTRHVVLPRAARVFSGASRQPRIPAVMASFSQHALRQLVTSPSSTADQQKRSAVQQRALSSGQRGVWGLLDAVQGKKMIGKDKHGNTYWEVSNPGQNPNPKREIDYFEKRMVHPLPSVASC